MKKEIYYLLKRVNKETKTEEFIKSRFNEQTHKIDYSWTTRDNNVDKCNDINVLHHITRDYEFNDNNYEYLIVEEMTDSLTGDTYIIEKPVRDKYYL